MNGLTTKQQRACALTLLLGLHGCRKEEPTPTAVEVAPRLVLPAPTIVTPTAPPPLGLEDDFDDEDFRVKVSAARLCVSQAPFLPPPGRRRVAVAVEVTAKTERLVPVGPLTFSLEDEEGHRYGATLAGCGPSFASQSLQKTQSVRGEVAFDVPLESVDLRLVYEPFLVGRPQITAHLGLPDTLGNETP